MCEPPIRICDKDYVVIPIQHPQSRVHILAVRVAVVQTVSLNTPWLRCGVRGRTDRPPVDGATPRMVQHCGPGAMGRARVDTQGIGTRSILRFIERGRV